MTDSNIVRSMSFQPKSRRSTPSRAFTLVEVMIAAFVVTLATMGILAMLIQAYKMNQAIRYRDAARAMLVSFSDQFIRLAIATDDGTGTFVGKPLFSIQSTPTGVGLNWGTTTGTSLGLPVKLGDAASGQVDAVITRQIHFLDESTGIEDTSDATTAAGYMLKGTFTISYSYNGKQYSETYNLARSVR